MSSLKTSLVKDSDFRYEVYLHDEFVAEYIGTLKGLAVICFDTMKELGLAELRKIYSGHEADFDPVLHTTQIKRGGIYPPCKSGEIENTKTCKYRKSAQSEFFNQTRKTAIRSEVMAPSDRCGSMLKPSRVGGDFFDYGYCIGGCSK